MKRTSTTESAANTANAQVAPVTNAIVAMPSRQVPRLREENRQTSLHSLPDELMRQVGRYLTLKEWVDLRQLCNACAEQVDRQPPFILLDPDVRTDRLIQQFLTDATPEYAFRLGNLVAKLKIGMVGHREKLDSILEAIGKARAWEVIKICKDNSSRRLASYSRPLLQGLKAEFGNIKRNLEYAGTLDKEDRESAEEVQRSSCLQLTSLNTAAVSEFLQFIAGNAEFKNLELDLKDSKALTQETFKVLQQMHGPIKCLTLRCMGDCDSRKILEAMSEKGLKSLVLFNSAPGEGIDLQPFLDMPLERLALHQSIPYAPTFVEAIGLSRTLKVLEIRGDRLSGQDDHESSGTVETDILSPALRMNQSIESLLLLDPYEDHSCSFVPEELLKVILNHGLLNHLEWDSRAVEWPMLAAPETPKKMNEVFFRMAPESVTGVNYFLRQLASLRCLGLELEEFGECNWEFLSTFDALGLQEFFFSVEASMSDSSPPLPIQKCFSHGLRRLELNVCGKPDYDGIDLAIGGATALTSLTLNGVKLDHRSIHGLITGLEKNQSLEQLKLDMYHGGRDNEMKYALRSALVIETIFDHPYIFKAFLGFNFDDFGTETYIPAGYAELLPHLDPALELVLSASVDIPPEGATPEEMRDVYEIYERIVKNVREKLQS